MSVHEATVTVEIPGRPTFTSKIPFDEDALAVWTNTMVASLMLNLAYTRAAEERLKETA